MWRYHFIKNKIFKLGISVLIFLLISVSMLKFGSNIESTQYFIYFSIALLIYFLVQILSIVYRLINRKKDKILRGKIIAIEKDYIFGHRFIIEYFDEKKEEKTLVSHRGLIIKAYSIEDCENNQWIGINVNFYITKDNTTAYVIDVYGGNY